MILVSLGSQCDPGLSLKKLKLKKETLPFDWVRSNSKIIYNVLQNGPEKYWNFSNISKDYYVYDIDCKEFENSKHINEYGQHFTHFDNLTRKDLKYKIHRQFSRFYEILCSKEHVVFIHSHEEYVYNKQSRDNRHMFYEYVCKINDFLKHEYPSLTFTILNIDIYDDYKDYGNIVNKKINYPCKLSDNGETHHKKYFNPYRQRITNTIKEYLIEIKI
jgi:hypothetical protein